MQNNHFRIATASLLFFFLISFGGIVHAATTVYPQPTAYVVDTVGILTPEEKAAMIAKIATFRKETSNELAILIIPTTEPETIEEYSIHVADLWKIGKKEQDNGILFTVAINDRATRIEIGQGLEGVLTDLFTTKIIADYALPQFKLGKYTQGINDTLDVLMSAAKKEFNVADYTANSNQNSTNDASSILPFLLFFGFNALAFWYRIAAKTKSWWAGGFTGGVICLILCLIFGAGLTLTGILLIPSIIFGLIFDFIASKKGPPKDGPRGGSGLGFWNGWIIESSSKWGDSDGGSSGGGFGGFGGGGFSGGGGSGKW